MNYSWTSETSNTDTSKTTDILQSSRSPFHLIFQYLTLISEIFVDLFFFIIIFLLGLMEYKIKSLKGHYSDESVNTHIFTDLKTKLYQISSVLF